MIKVNLNNTKTSYQENVQGPGLTTAKGLTALTGITSTVKSSLKKINLPHIGFYMLAKISINLSLMYCFPLGLKIYEMDQISKLEALKAQTAQKLKSKQNQLRALEEELGKYNYLPGKAKVFSEKIEFLKNLADSRLIVPRTIDLVQNKISEKVWLDSLSLNMKEEQIGIVLSGKSLNEADINFFANSLHEILDKNSITVNMNDIKEGGSVVNVDFQLQGVVKGKKL